MSRAETGHKQQGALWFITVSIAVSVRHTFVSGSRNKWTFPSQEVCFVLLIVIIN